MNRERTTEELRAHAESITKHGRQKPLVVKTEELDGKPITMVLDGWSSVLVAISNNIDVLPAVEVIDCEPDDLPDLMAELQTTHHNDVEEDYKRFEFYFGLISKGKGHRSDLEEKQQEIEDDGKDQ
jgi:hypothetical protein